MIVPGRPTTFTRLSLIQAETASGNQTVIHDLTVASTSDGTAKFQTSSEISCKLPEIASQDTAYYQLQFEFSYDGVQYSNPLDLTVFDGECLRCDGYCEVPDNWVLIVSVSDSHA